MSHGVHTFGILVADRSAGQWEESLEMHGGGKTVLVHMPESMTVVDHEKRRTMELTPLAMGWAKSEDKLGFSYAIRVFCSAPACLAWNSGRPMSSAHDINKR